MRRVGILGGAFNPPHAGHLRLAELALEHLQLDEVRFVPTAASPHKLTLGPEGNVRLELLQAALASTGKPFVADDMEVRRGGVSYTVDTLERLVEAEPETAWIWLMGSDQLPGLSGWRQLSRILELASLGIAHRPGFSLDVPAPLADRLDVRWAGVPGQLVVLPCTYLDLASSVLRQSLEDGNTPEGIPIQVRDVIRRESLYRGSSKQEFE